MTWPVLTLALTTIPALASMITADQADQSFEQAAGSVAGWLLNADGAQPAEMASGFGFLAVMATIVIGMAFSLPPQGAQALPKKNRELVEFLTFGVTFLVSLFSTVVLWVILWWQPTFELVLLLLSAWLVSVVAGLVDLKRPALERVPAAKREREKLRDGAEKSGFTATTITRDRRVGAEAAYWLIPLMGLLLLGAVSLALDSRGAQIDGRGWALLLVLACGAVAMSAAWRMTAPFPPHKPSDRVFSWIGRGGGLLAMLLAAGSALDGRSWWFAASSGLAIAGAVALYAVPTVPNHVPFMATIRDVETTKRLVQADEWYEKVLQEFDDELEREHATSSTEDEERDPLFRIEVFRRGSRRRVSRGEARASGDV